MSYTKAMKHYNNPRKWRRTRVKDSRGMSAAGKRGNWLVFGKPTTEGTQLMMMTYNEALKIQAEQLDWYLKRYSPEFSAEFRAQMAADTKPCPGDPDAPMDVIQINRLVPRGGDIEHRLGFDGGGD